MVIWKSVVGKLWMTIIALVALVLIILGLFLLEYIDIYFSNSNSNDVKKLFVYTGIIGFLLTTFFAFFLSTKITQPLLQMKKAADLITQGDYGTRVVIRSSDEIGELAKTFNHMAEELEETIKDLSHEKEHLASVLRSMADAVITFDGYGNIILANPQGDRIIREWSSISWIDPLQKDLPGTHQIPEPLQSLFKSVVEANKELTDNLHVLNGVWSVVMAPLNSKDMIRGAVAVLRNVTEEYRLDKLRKDFVANVSHELRTPLSMLQGYSEALLDDIPGSAEERKELVQVIHDESLRMSRLVVDLLDLARMETGHFERNYQRVDIKMLVHRVQRKFLVMAREQGLALNLSFSEEALFVQHGDEDQLEQVLTNLLDNAVRHSPRDSQIEITVRPVWIKEVDEAVKIEIKDQGYGIPAEDLPYIFERFYKADKARTRGNSGGTGLGLAIVKNIVESHHGNVAVESVPGQGTTFSIVIPCNCP
ncbi:MAG TPA: ATP-binding protein [Bacilli bacterium]